ncbi:MAG: hypothetical protein QY310_07700 [Candidatus Jettenia sp. CY-1]|nr:MAG: hypothetical protein QY310_07700 [Candidatus Jettenia sp. CY-1]
MHTTSPSRFSPSDPARIQYKTGVGVNLVFALVMEKSTGFGLA